MRELLDAAQRLFHIVGRKQFERSGRGLDEAGLAWNAKLFFEAGMDCADGVNIHDFERTEFVCGRVG